METSIIVLLDESGSMYNKKSDIIGGYNTFIEDQKKILNDSAKFSLIKFNDKIKVVHNNISLKEVKNISEETYSPNGLTALYDAISKGIQIVKSNKTNDRVIFLIMTDGEENCSR